MRSLTLLLLIGACHAEAERSPAKTPVVDPAPVPVESELELQKRAIRAEFPAVAGIGVDELAARLAAGDVPLLLDVRAPAEFQVSHLQGARRAGDLEQALALLGDAPHEREIVVYCSIGYRSAHLADQLQGQGFTHVRNLEGSIFEWANSGHAVYGERGPVDLVHPYDAQWGRLLDRRLWSEIE